MPTRAVLFRFEGVVADVANVHIAAWERTFGRLGWDVPPEVCARSAEVDDREFLASVFANRSIEGDVDGWVASKQGAMVRMLDDWPRLSPGVADFISAIAGRARLAVVSSTWRENIAVVLRRGGLGDAIEAVVGKEDLRSTNPSAGLTLALRRLSVPPAEAVSLESSPGGLSDAKRSGVRAVAVGRWAGSEASSAASERIERLTGDPLLLERLGIA